MQRWNCHFESIVSGAQFFCHGQQLRPETGLTFAQDYSADSVEKMVKCFATLSVDMI